MMFTARRPTSRIDVCNYNTLLYHDYDTNINFTKNYFLSQSPRPMSYRDLRSVMSNIVPSDVVVLPESLNSSQTSVKNSPGQNRRKHSSRKRHNNQGVDAYRTLIRTDSHSSAVSDRDLTNDEMMLLANSFIIDHIPPLPASGVFRPQNSPNILKHRTTTTNNNRIGTSHIKSSYSKSSSLRIQHVGHTRPTPIDIQYEETNNNNRVETSHRRSSYSSSPSLRIQHIAYTPPTPPQLIHRTSPVDTQYEENSPMITTIINSSPILEAQTRKQLHVYMPQTISC